MPEHGGNWPCQSLPGAACDLHLGCWLKERTRPKALGLLIAVGQQCNDQSAAELVCAFTHGCFSAELNSVLCTHGAL